MERREGEWREVRKSDVREVRSIEERRGEGNMGMSVKLVCTICSLQMLESSERSCCDNCIKG